MWLVWFAAKSTLSSHSLELDLEECSVRSSPSTFIVKCIFWVSASVRRAQDVWYWYLSGLSLLSLDHHLLGFCWD